MAVTERVRQTLLGKALLNLDQTELLREIRQVANRVTMGLVLASLVVGAAMLARVDATIATIFLEDVRQRR